LRTRRARDGIRQIPLFASSGRRVPSGDDAMTLCEISPLQKGLFGNRLTSFRIDSGHTAARSKAQTDPTGGSARAGPFWSARPEGRCHGKNQENGRRKGRKLDDGIPADGRTGQPYLSNHPDRSHDAGCLPEGNVLSSLFRFRPRRLPRVPLPHPDPVHRRSRLAEKATGFKQ
jgi:hypothetical protein